MTKAHPKNFCGGNFQDWLEVNLTDRCNGACSWCVELGGFHPAYHAPWEILFEKIIASGKQNIILLGGEPTLFPSLGRLIEVLSGSGRSVYITTNGSTLKPSFICRNLSGLTGINISIHHYERTRNFQITGIKEVFGYLKASVEMLRMSDVAVRFNCNAIKGQIDSADEISRYVLWAKKMGAQKVRFAELKNDAEGFVDLATILDHKYGLNDNPFTEGCHSDTVLHGVPVNFRQMCGLQTSCRAGVDCPEQVSKQVLYYDGKMYDGWQMAGEDRMGDDRAVDVIAVLLKVERGDMTAKEAYREIGPLLGADADAGPVRKITREEASRATASSGAGCQY